MVDRRTVSPPWKRPQPSRHGTHPHPREKGVALSTLTALSATIMVGLWWLPLDTLPPQIVYYSSTRCRFRKEQFVDPGPVHVDLHADVEIRFALARSLAARATRSCDVLLAPPITHRF